MERERRGIRMTDISGHVLPVIESARACLRTLEPRDVADLFAIFSDPEVMRYWSSPAWESETAATNLVESVHCATRAGTLYQWGVAQRETDRVIGTCTLAQIDRQNRRAEVGFALRRDSWGRGLMSEAVRSLIEFAVESLSLHRLEADVDPRNAASLRLLERLGFQREGYMRERWLVGEEVNDTVFLGLLAADWRAARAPR